MNKEELSKTIKDTRGYILYQMEQRGDPVPDISYFLDDLNEYNLNYVLKNYDLTSEQIEVLRPYFRVHSNNAVVNSELSQEQIIDYLKTGKELPPKTFVSPDIMKAYAFDSYSDEALLYSYAQYDPEDIKTFSPEFFKGNIYLLNSRPELFKEDWYQKLFLESLTKERDFYDTFKHFPLTDKDLVVKYLKLNTTQTPYEKMSKISGFKELISPDEYFRDYKGDAEHVVDTELVLDSWIAKNSYDLQSVLYSDVSDEKFEKAFTTRYFEEKFKGERVYQGYFDKDHIYNVKNKMTHYNRVMAEYFDKKPDEFINNLNRLTLDNFIKQPATLDFRIKMSHVLTASDKWHSRVLESVGLDAMSKAALERPSINKLLALNIECERTNHYSLMREAIEYSLEQLDKKSLQKIGYEGKSAASIYKSDDFLTDSKLSSELMINRLAIDPGYLAKQDLLPDDVLSYLVENDEKDYLSSYKHEFSDNIKSQILKTSWGTSIVEPVSEVEILKDMLESGKLSSYGLSKEFIKAQCAEFARLGQFEHYAKLATSEMVVVYLQSLSNVEALLDNNEFVALLEKNIRSHNSTIRYDYSFSLAEKLLEKIGISGVTAVFEDSPEYRAYMVEKHPTEAAFGYGYKGKLAAADLVSIYQKIDFFAVGKHTDMHHIFYNLEDFDNFIHVSKPYPELHAIAVSGRMNRQRVEGRPQDQLQHEFVMENCDFDVLLEGMRVMLSKLTPDRDEKGVKAIYETLRSISWRFSYEIKGTDYTNLSQEGSERILDVLMSHSPLIATYFYRIGTIGNTTEELKTNTARYMDSIELDKFLYPNKKLVVFNVTKTTEIIPSIVRAYIQRGNLDAARKIQYAYEQEKFNQQLNDVEDGSIFSEFDESELNLDVEFEMLDLQMFLKPAVLQKKMKNKL